MTYTEGREQFELMLAQHERALRGLNQEFLAGLSDADRTVLLQLTIDSAWDNRDTLPSYMSKPGFGLPKFWKRCLKFAATSREKWLVSVAVLPGVYEKKWVLGQRIGEQ